MLDVIVKQAEFALLKYQCFLLHQGDRPDGIYELQAGRLKAYFTTPEGKQVTLNIFTPRIQLGEANLIFKIPHIVSYLSQFMSLLPGDVISTGTPAGVGMGMDPPTYLKPGDVVELGIDGLGSSKQSVAAYTPSQ